MKSNIYIPEKIRIGFQKRKDTFTGKLAYVICFDEKGNLRKENSWESWRDKSIQHIDLDNKPTEGFVFNKGVQRHGYYGSGKSIIRVHHPDDFEFEISIDNLVAILMNSDVSKRDIKGKFVFAWAGKDLILLPVDSIEYKSAIDFTDKQFKNISTKELKKGFTYSLKKSKQQITYLGYFNFNNKYPDVSNYKDKIKETKKHIFYDENYKFITPSITTLSECVVESIDKNYGIAYAKYEKSTHFKSLNMVVFKDPEVKKFGQEKDRRVFKNFGENRILSVTLINFAMSDNIYFDNYQNKFMGVDFAFFNETKNGYLKEHMSPYFYKNSNNEYSNNIEIFKKEFPELFLGKVDKKDFLNSLKEKGFKSVYLKSDIEESSEIRI